MAKVKYGIFSDIHSNQEAFCAVLADMNRQGVTHPICLGDTVGYNANPSACLDQVRKLSCPVIRGNHDHIVAHLEVEDINYFNAVARAGILFSAKQLLVADKEYLAGMPLKMQIDDFMIVHASLHRPEEWNYVISIPEAEKSFAHQLTPLCFCGHTHVAKVFARKQGIFELKVTDGKLSLQPGWDYLVNVGSVGQPRDRDWRASYVIYTPASKMIEFRRLDYDLAAAQEKILAAGLPKSLALRIGLGV